MEILTTAPIDLDETTLEQVTAGAQPVLVDFWAPWCGPCRVTAPAVERLARTRAGRLAVGKVNVDDHAVLAARHGIQSIPTLILFHRGRVAARWVGAMHAAPLEAAVDRVLAALPPA